LTLTDKNSVARNDEIEAKVRNAILMLEFGMENYPLVKKCILTPFKLNMNVVTASKTSFRTEVET
jgi:hypothetical protein